MPRRSGGGLTALMSDLPPSIELVPHTRRATDLERAGSVRDGDAVVAQAAQQGQFGGVDDAGRPVFFLPGSTGPVAWRRLAAAISQGLLDNIKSQHV